MCVSPLNSKEYTPRDLLKQKNLLQKLVISTAGSIYRQIDLADIIIADMSTKNPNVFYEVGYAHAKEKPCVLLTAVADDIPFDLKHKRHIIYGNSIDTLRKKISEEFLWVKKEKENIKKSNINVILTELRGILDKTKYDAKASLTFKIDLSNKTNASSDIEAAYLYTGNGWDIWQDNKICSSTQSDILPYTLRHFLSMPVRKLSKNAWAQLLVESRKTLGTAYKGEELKDSYKIMGKALLRLVTKKGSFDYELPISITVSEIPF